MFGRVKRKMEVRGRSGGNIHNLLIWQEMKEEGK